MESVKKDKATDRLRGRHTLDRIAGWGAALGIITAFLFFGGGWGAPGPYELMIRVPERVSVDQESFPIRAGLVIRETARWENIELGQDLEIIGESEEGGRRHFSLREGEFLGREGQVERISERSQRVIARVEHLDELVTVEASVDVSRDSAIRPMESRDRQVDAAGQSSPELGVRVVGGLCVRSIPCTILIFLPGGLDGRRLLFGGTVEVEVPLEGEQVTPGPAILQAEVRVNDTQGEVELWDPEPEGPRVATASIPMAHSSSYLNRSDGGAWELRHELPAAAVIAEVFHGGRWVGTQSNPGPQIVLSSTSGLTDEPGLWRIQIRGEELREDSAGVRVLWRAPREASTSRVSAFLRDLRAVQWSPDELSERVLGEASLWQVHPERAERFVLASLEEQWRRLPRWIYGGPQALDRWEERRQRGIGLGVLVLILLGVVIAILVYARGQRATAEAAAVLRDAQSETGEPSTIPGQRRPLYPVILGASLVLLAFLFVAALLYSREYF